MIIDYIFKIISYLQGVPEGLGEIKFLELEHNLFKNVSNWGIFLFETQIQTIKYSLNYRVEEKYATKTKSKIFILPFRMFQKKKLPLELGKGCK